MADLATMTWATQDLLYGLAEFERPIEDTVVQWPGSTVATTIEMGSPNLWSRGDVLEIIPSEGSTKDQVELALAEDDHPAAGSTMTIRRRAVLNGQPALNPTAGFVRKNPLFPIRAIGVAVEEVVDSELWPHVWTTKIRKISNVTPSTDRLYDLQTGDEDVVRVYQMDINGINSVSNMPWGWWDYEAGLHSDAVGVNKVVLHRVFDESLPVYVVTKERPFSASTVTTMGDALATMVPYMAAAKMMVGRVSAVDYDPSRQERDQHGRTSYATQHYRTFAAEFLRLRNEERNRLLNEQPKAPKRYRGHPARVRRLTG